MGIADRYLLRRVGVPLLAVVMVVGVVVSLWQLGRISSLVLVGYQDVGLLLQLIADLVPNFAGLALGAAGIFGCVVAYDRLAEDGELTAMSAGGVPPRRIFGPAILCGVVLGSLVLAAGIWGEPWGASRYGTDVALLATRSFSRSLKTGTFNTVGGLASVYVGSAVEDDRGQIVWKDVVVGRELPDGPMVLVTEHARVEPVGVGLIHLQTGPGEAVLPSPRPDEINRLSFERSTMTVDVLSWARGEAMKLYEFQALTFHQLWKEADNPQSRHELPKLRHFLWQKLSLPFGVPILCVLGALCGGQRAGQARARAYLTAALMVAAYFGLLGFGRNLVIQGVLPAWAGANVSNAVGAFVLALYWRARGTRWA